MAEPVKASVKALALPDACSPPKGAAVDARRATVTPQEQELVNEMFDRLAKLESILATQMPSA